MQRKLLYEKIMKEYPHLMINLANRWFDECQYEDINDYLDVAHKAVPEAYAIKKRPFTVYFHTDDTDEWDLFIKVTATHIEYGGQKRASVASIPGIRMLRNK